MSKQTKLEYVSRDFQKALGQMLIALKQPKDEFVRDSAIQRFEFTFELFWKLLKEYALMHGLDPRSPRECIRTAYELRTIEDEAVFQEMLKSRNLSAHTYLEETAEEIYALLPGYAGAMQEVARKIEVERSRE